MPIKINWKDLEKRIINWVEVEKVMSNWVQIRPTSSHPDECIIFYYLANPRWSWAANEIRVKSWISWNRDIYVDWVKRPSWSLRLGSNDGQEHLVEIYPVNDTYWWAKAFKWCKRMTRLIYDWTYKSFADSETNTWDGYRASIYTWHTLLREIPESEEAIPDSVIYVWNNFRSEEFHDRNWSYSIVPRKETFPKNAISVWDGFRSRQYSISTIQLNTLEEKFSDSVLTIWGSFRERQFYDWSVYSAIESMSSNLVSAWGNFRYGQFSYSWLGGSVTVVQNNNVSLSMKRVWQFDFYYGNARNIIFTILGNSLEQLPTDYNPMWLRTNRIQSIWVKNSLLSDYQTTSPWDSLAAKFTWF